MNGTVEATNKNIKKIVQKMVKTYKNWHKILPFTLHGYITSVHTSTGVTPYLLVYGMEVVLPIEVEIPSLRLIMEADLDEAEWVQSIYDQLNLIEEKRLMAIFHGQLYHRHEILWPFPTLMFQNHFHKQLFLVTYVFPLSLPPLLTFVHSSLFFSLVVGVLTI